MDRTLAEHYNTQGNLGILGGGYTGEDLQKQAAAEFLVKLAAEEGVDLGSLSDNEVGSLLSEIEGGMGKTASAEENEMQEKLAEADFLGRAMAHAYVDELAGIEKQAKSKAQAAVGLMDKVKSFASGQGEHLGSMGRSIKSMVTGQPSKQAIEEAKKRARSAGIRGKENVLSAAASQFGGKGGTRIEALKSLGRAAKGAAPTLAAGTAAVGGGAYGLHRALKGKEQEKESALQIVEQAAFERAQEMLAEAGYAEKQAEDIGTVVETRALQMLEEAGYQVEWNQ